MKHLLAASALFGMSVLASACGTDVDETDRAQYPNGNVTYTLYLYDAQTGAALTDATVEVQVGTAEPLKSTKVGGAFVVEAVPTGIFSVTIDADGYLPLTGVQQFTGTPVTQFANPTFTVQYAAMYPTQSVTADQTVKVYDATTGAAIASGQILATLPSVPTTIAPPPVGTGSASVFTGSYGFLPNVITAQISAGTATLPRDQLVFGGTYTIALVGVQNAQGAYLNAGATTVQVGRGANPTVIFASAAAVTPTALTATNENPANKVAASTLTLNFPYPVETCTDRSTWTFTADASGTGTVTPVVPVTTGDKVSVTPQAGGTTVVIKPNATGDDGTATTLNYNIIGVGLRLVGNPTCGTLGSGILLRGGAAVSNVIYVR